jgi:hypothetical protein
MFDFRKLNEVEAEEKYQAEVIQSCEAWMIMRTSKGL